MISQVKGLLWLLLSVIFLLLGSSGSCGSRCTGGWYPHGARAVLMSADSLGSAGESRSGAAAQLCCFRTGKCGSAAAPGWGPESRKDSLCLCAVNPTKQSGCYCCWKIKCLCKLSGRAFTFTHVFSVWSMPKCRTWKSVIVKERCIFTVLKVDFMGKFLM